MEAVRATLKARRKHPTVESCERPPNGWCESCEGTYRVRQAVWHSSRPRVTVTIAAIRVDRHDDGVWFDVAFTDEPNGLYDWRGLHRVGCSMLAEEWGWVFEGLGFGTQ